MNVFSAGNFRIKIYTDGWPISIRIYQDGKEITRIDHHDIADLEYIIARAKSSCRAALPENSKHEV